MSKGKGKKGFRIIDDFKDQISGDIITMIRKCPFSKFIKMVELRKLGEKQVQCNMHFAPGKKPFFIVESVTVNDLPSLKYELELICHQKAPIIFKKDAQKMEDAK
jgi:hypothetical protein